MDSSCKFQVSSKCIDIQIFDNKSIATASNDGAIKIVQDCKSKDYRIQNISGQKQGAFRSFERDGSMLFAFLSDEGSKLIVYDFDNKTPVASYASDKPITMLEVDYSGEVILFYTSDSRLNVFNVGEKKLTSSIHIDNNFTPSKIVFNYDLSKVALLSESGQGYVCSPILLKLIGAFTTAGQDTCFNGFLDEKSFVSVSREGQTTIVDTDTMKSSRYNMRFPTFCKKGFFLSDNALFFGIFRDAGFTVFDVESEKNICSGKLDGVAEPQLARFDEKALILGVEDSKGGLSVFDVGAAFAVFRSLFSGKDFHGCYKLLAENELLVLTDAPKMLEDVFSAFAMSALKMAEAENYDGAIRQLSPFLKVVQKKSELKEIVESIETMRSFVNFIKAKKYANAYNLSDRYRFLRLTGYYKIMEDEWHAIVEQAKNLAVAGRLEEAKESFAAFRGVGSKTELIKQLLAERETINLFLKKLASKDFKAAFELANLHPFLKEIKEFKSLKELGEKGIQKAHLLLKTGELQKAAETISTLKAIPLFRAQAESLELRAGVYHKYYAYKKAGDRTKVKILEKKYPYLTESNSCPI